MKALLIYLGSVEYGWIVLIYLLTISATSILTVESIH